MQAHSNKALENLWIAPRLGQLYVKRCLEDQSRALHQLGEELENATPPVPFAPHKTVATMVKFQAEAMQRGARYWDALSQRSAKA